MSKLNCQKGQATIEFIFSFSIACFFLIYFIIYCLNLGAGYLAHYANFVASRTYLSYDSGKATIVSNYIDAEQRSKFEFQKIAVHLKSLGVKFEGDGVKFNGPINGTFYDYYGSYLQFLLPFEIGVDDDDFVKKSFLTESFLGKEPPRAECACQILQAMGLDCQGGQTPNDLSVDITIYDNGC